MPTVGRRLLHLHTSKRMHFIEDASRPTRSTRAQPCIRQNVCTSLRRGLAVRKHHMDGLAYVKTYALH